MSEVIKPYQSMSDFLIANPRSNHSSRVLSKAIIAVISAWVNDAYLQDIPGISAAVADAILQTVGGTIGPALTFGATSLSFTSTNVGSNTSLTVTISNPGTADLVITSLIPTGDFAVATIVGN